MLKYELHNIFGNVCVLAEITWGIYVTPQAGFIAYNKLIKRLSYFLYHPSKRTPVLWKHETCPVNFCLVVDDFGVKYGGHEHADHFANAIKTNFSVTFDWDGDLNFSVTLKWDYNAHSVNLFIPS